MARFAPLVLLVFAFLPVGCGSPDFWAFESITSGPNPGSTLILVWLSDAPADDTEVVEITIEGIELVGPAGSAVLSDERRTVDLLSLQNGIRLQVAERAVPAGTYERLRLTLARIGPFAPSVVAAGRQHPLQFTGPLDHIIDVPYTFEARSEAQTEIQLDFHVRRSLDRVEDTWFLQPHIDAVDPALVGDVSGRIVDASGLPVAGRTVVAEQGGFEVRSTRTASDGTYRIGLLPGGSYTIHTLGPLGVLAEERDVVVTIGGTLTLDFRE